jgi:hypothetical protein
MGIFGLKIYHLATLFGVEQTKNATLVQVSTLKGAAATKRKSHGMRK